MADLALHSWVSLMLTCSPAQVPYAGAPPLVSRPSD
jgi:hypothetical protein